MAIIIKFSILFIEDSPPRQSFSLAKTSRPTLTHTWNSSIQHIAIALPITPSHNLTQRHIMTSRPTEVTPNTISPDNK